jgi:hypothetical protein
MANNQYTYEDEDGNQYVYEEEDTSIESPIEEPVAPKKSYPADVELLAGIGRTADSALLGLPSRALSAGTAAFTDNDKSFFENYKANQADYESKSNSILGEGLSTATDVTGAVVSPVGKIKAINSLPGIGGLFARAGVSGVSSAVGSALDGELGEAGGEFGVSAGLSAGLEGFGKGLGKAGKAIVGKLPTGTKKDRALQTLAKRDDAVTDALGATKRTTDAEIVNADNIAKYERNFVNKSGILDVDPNDPNALVQVKQNLDALVENASKSKASILQQADEALTGQIAGRETNSLLREAKSPSLMAARISEIDKALKQERAYDSNAIANAIRNPSQVPDVNALKAERLQLSQELDTLLEPLGLKESYLQANDDMATGLRFGNLVNRTRGETGQGLAPAQARSLIDKGLQAEDLTKSGVVNRVGNWLSGSDTESVRLADAAGREKKVIDNIKQIEGFRNGEPIRKTTVDKYVTPRIQGITDFLDSTSPIPGALALGEAGESNNASAEELPIQQSENSGANQQNEANPNSSQANLSQPINHSPNTSSPVAVNPALSKMQQVEELGRNGSPQVQAQLEMGVRKLMQSGLSEADAKRKVAADYSGLPGYTDPYPTGLPRKTETIDPDTFIPEVLRRTKGDPVAQELLSEMTKAFKSQDRYKLEMMHENLTRAYPDLFESGYGVNGRIYSLDEQNKYMKRLGQLKTEGRLTPKIIALQQNKFFDKNDLGIIPLDNYLDVNPREQLKQSAVKNKARVELDDGTFAPTY